MENKQTVTVIGAGLAGSEAAWQISQAGYSVRLFEMKPQKFSPAHKSAGFAELICSNSLKAARIDSAAGLLKEEMRRMDSLLVACADKTAVPAGGALEEFPEGACARGELRSAFAVAVEQATIRVAQMDGPHARYRVEPARFFEPESGAGEPGLEVRDRVFEGGILAGEEMFGHDVAGKRKGRPL